MLRESFECVLAAAKYKSFAKAAKELYLSTPAVTQRINAIEESLGFKLFIRSNKGAILTAAGEAFVSDAEVMLAKYEETVERCRAIAEKENSHISIGVSGTINNYLLPKICERFKEHNKNVVLSFADIKDPTSALLQGLVDIIITYGNIGVAFPQIVNTTLIMDEVYCYMPSGHRLSDMKYIRTADLLQEEMIMPPLECSEYHRNLYSVLKKSNPSLKADFLLSVNVGVLKSITSDAVSLQPRSYHLESGSITGVPFESYPYISIDALTREEPQGILKAFIEEAKDLLHCLQDK